MSDPPVVQRWRQRRDVYRPAGEPIDTRRYEVAAIAGDRTAKQFVISHHYSGSYPAARFRFGLYLGEHLVGVAVFSHPCNNAVLTGTFRGVEPLECVELGRFVLLDDVPANGESWMLGRCFELLRREGIIGIVSFADPEPRTCAAGTVAFGGHVGTIYQATNGIYLGRSTPRRLRLLPDGSVLSDRAIAKLRAGHKGWQYVARKLIEAGAGELTADRVTWAEHWLAKLTRPQRHGGCHKYAWGLRAVIHRSLAPAAKSYPKGIAWPSPRLSARSHPT
jgi:hypothetical protein